MGMVTVTLWGSSISCATVLISFPSVLTSATVTSTTFSNCAFLRDLSPRRASSFSASLFSSFLTSSPAVLAASVRALLPPSAAFCSLVSWSVSVTVTVIAPSLTAALISASTSPVMVSSALMTKPSPAAVLLSLLSTLMSSPLTLAIGFLTPQTVQTPLT